MINFEPTFNLDVGAYLKFELHLYFINFEFSVNLMPYMFRPFDFTFAIDPEFPRRYCYGFDYWTKGFALQIEMDQSVKECTYGALGYLVDDWNDCKWQHYKPELPIFEIQATDFADYDGSYWPYTCVNFYSAEW